jgi:prepilin-type processing-associated H-X9-DG protein
MYAGDHREQFPSKVISLNRYIAGQGKLFFCPSDSARTPTNDIPSMVYADNDSYCYRIYDTDSSGLRLSESTPPNQLLMCDKDGADPEPTTSVEGGEWGGNHKDAGGNILYLDGHVEWWNSYDPTEEGTLNNDEWETITATGGVDASAWDDGSTW